MRYKLPIRFNYNAPVTLTFTFISLFLLFVGYIGGIDRVMNTIALGPHFELLNLIRLFTYVFGHANFNHFFGNFSIILLIGPMLEEKYGSQTLLWMMLITALTTGLIHILFFHTAVLGASGIVFMLILLTPFTNVQKGKIPLTFILIALIYLGNEIFLWVSTTDNISRFGHVFGGIIGAILGYFITKQSQFQVLNKRVEKR